MVSRNKYQYTTYVRIRTDPLTAWSVENVQYTWYDSSTSTYTYLVPGWYS